MSSSNNREEDARQVFATAIGRVGVAWSDTGVTRLRLEAIGRQPQLPQGDAVGTEQVAEIPSFVGELLCLLKAYGLGQTVNFGSVPVDLGKRGDFDRDVYGLARQLGWGETTTYGDLALKLGSIGLSRAVGQSMGRNPVPIIIPCHRVLAKGQKVGGFSAPGGARTKEYLLGLEGVALETSAPLLAFCHDDAIGVSGSRAASGRR